MQSKGKRKRSGTRSWALERFRDGIGINEEEIDQMGRARLSSSVATVVVIVVSLLSVGVAVTRVYSRYVVQPGRSPAVVDDERQGVAAGVEESGVAG